MFTGKFTERPVSSRVHHQSFRTVVRDVFFVIQRHRLVAALAPIRVTSSQYAFERFAKLRVENRIDDRVEGGVRVAQPSEDFKGDVRYAGFAEGCDDVDAEEWNLELIIIIKFIANISLITYPTNQKYTHDNANSNRGFVIADVIRRTLVIMQVNVKSFVLLLDGFLFRRRIRYVDWPGDGSDAFDMFLSVTVQSTVDACNRKICFIVFIGSIQLVV